MDIYDPAYPAHVWLMIFYGLLDAMWQTTAFWLIGAMSNDTSKLAIYAGFCERFKILTTGISLTSASIRTKTLDHSIQSAGAAGVWRMDAVGLPFVHPLTIQMGNDGTDTPSLVPFI